eukprot:15203638-Heterocapsa_arctica.AAC.1
MRDKQYATELVRELQMSASAARHQPFEGWTTGTAGANAGRTFAGMRARGRAIFSTEGYTIGHEATITLRQL